MIVTDALEGLEKKKTFSTNLKKGWVFFISLFSMLKYTSMFENASSPLSHHLRIFYTKGLVVHYLKCYLNPRILIEQKISLNVYDARAIIQCNMVSYYVLHHTRGNLKDKNQYLTSLTGITSQFEVQ